MTIPRPARLARGWAMFGGALWVGAQLGPPLAAPGLDEVARLMTLAPLVLVPLTWSQRQDASEGALERAIAWSLGPASALVLASFYAGQGWPQAALILPWLLVCAAMALSELLVLRLRLRDRAPIGWSRWARLAAHVYLPGGAVWWIAWRAGVELLGFPLLIVLLTAMHFHFAGYMAPWLASQAAALGHAQTSSAARRRATGVIVAGVMSGMPLIALGIQLSAPLEVVSTLIFALSIMALGGLNLTQLGELAKRDRLGAALLGLSALSSFVTMLAALAFVARHLTLALGVTIPQMVLVHGWVNALGFALAGALGWARCGDQRSVQPEAAVDAPSSIS